MLRGLDHVVILVPELDVAIDTYTRLGFTVVRGGRHAVGTHNALIGFQDGSYIELIAFWEDAPSHRWHRFRGLSGGLVDFCMRTTDLAGDADTLRQAGIAMSEKQAMDRVRPDGYRVQWSLTLATETQGITPFLIEDVTPREERVPREVEHANRVTGISTVTIAVSDLDMARRAAVVLGDARPTEGVSARGPGVRYVSEGHACEYVSRAGDGEFASFLSARDGDGGIYAVSLKTDGQQKTIEPPRAHNARLSLVAD